MIQARTGLTQNFTTEISNGKHTLTADEPEKLGGVDKGMTPMELLKGALASCTSITLKMYLDLKKIEVEEIKVEIDHSKNEDNKEVFTRNITIVPSVEEDFRKRVLHVANRCPVHKLLEENVDINTNLN